MRHDNELARRDFRGLGMRIEDDVLINSDGVTEILTKSAVRDSNDIEVLMMSAR